MWTGKLECDEMRQIIRNLVLAIVIVASSAHAAHASETELREAYAAYQEAAEAGDIHGAMPHAQAAYEEGVELYGVSSRNTGLLAFNYGFTLNEISRCEVAVEVLAVSVSALRDSGETSSEQLFDSLFELGRAQRHIVDGTDGDETLQEALVLATELFGPTSEQVGLVYMELGRPDLRSAGNVPPGRSRVIIGQALSNSETHRSHLISAIGVLSRFPDRASEVAQIQVMQSLDLIEQGEYRDATEMMAPAIDQLFELRYADDTMVSIYLNWLNSRSNGWSYQRKEDEIVRLAQFASMRPDGELHALVRVAPEYPRAMLNRRAEGRVMYSFSVNERGRPSSIEVETSTEDGFIDTGLEAIPLWFYLPRMVNGQPVPVDRVLFAFDFVMAD